MLRTSAVPSERVAPARRYRARGYGERERSKYASNCKQLHLHTRRSLERALAYFSRVGIEF